ncbi:hypothetical protein MycrhN_4031 [Mycolicibacterium rhodesiae NBB3]|jgi:hypothetical protein|uniref:Uncharacterized protein n=1 Tax=Mycolicibacterium rhodesiae (strain NBB3) TaxID=710685 RepID=G8RH59_MYCRN|nr:hypothetical protein MycrhN_4031 [Mycolicibacterium rhodesiae NBB3]
MSDVTSIGTQVPRSRGITPQIRGSRTGIGVIGYEGVGFAEGLRGLRTHRIRHRYCRRGDLRGAQINLVHNVFRSAGCRQ